MFQGECHLAFPFSFLHPSHPSHKLPYTPILQEYNLNTNHAFYFFNLLIINYH